MREAIRCCISCILPCGALDVVRIVHASGRVEEITGTVSAGDIMQANPKHVLREPPSASASSSLDVGGGCAGETPKAVTLPPDAELRRGRIYFLVPASAAPEKAPRPPPRRGRRRRRKEEGNVNAASAVAGAPAMADKTMLLLNERYLSEILSEKAAPSSCREKRRGRVGVWRPHLDSISECSNELYDHRS